MKFIIFSSYIENSILYFSGFDIPVFKDIVFYIKFYPAQCMKKYISYTI